MAEIIEMPKLSDTMETGTLIKWLKAEGDSVATGDILAEVETDKATMELESFEDGVILKLVVAEGDSVAVGQPVAVIGEAGDSVPEGLGGTSGTKPAADPEGEEPDTPPESPTRTTAKAPEAPADDDDGSQIKASPLARKMAADKGIPLGSIQGTGPGGRVVKADVLAAIETGGQPVPAPAPTKTAPPAAASSLPAVPVDADARLPVSSMRGVIAKRLLESKTQIPHFYLQIEVDAAPLMELRGGLNRSLADLPPEKGGIKFTVNDFILKASAEALRRVPMANASWGGDHIATHGSVHLAFAVAVEDGLVTPTIKDAHAKPLRQIAIEAKELIGKAKSKKLKPDEMSGSTFTVTNLGMYGIDSFYGIINPPNAAILSVGATITKPVVNPEGNIVAGQRMMIGLSGDHRVVDGAVGAAYLAALKEILETPALMLV